MNSSTEKAAEISNVVGLLGQITELSASDRNTLKRAWAAVDPGTFQATTQPQAMAGDIESNLLEQGNLTEERLRAWVQSLTHLAKRSRLEKLEAAMQEATEAWEVQILRTEIAALYDKDLVFAVETAVVRYAYEHPILSVVGIVGLLGGLFMVAKFVLIKIF